MPMLQRLLFRFSHRLLPGISQPLGHFYSPVCDPADLETRRDEVWARDELPPGIDFAHDAQCHLLRDVFPSLLKDFDYPATTQDPHAFFLHNSQFSEADARALFALLRHWRPRRLVEVGSGFSTLLSCDVKRRFLGDALSITAIEPFPRPFLSGLPGLDELRVERVQETPRRVFDTLEAGDVLFIDSSHVLKTGSDLTCLLARILPILAPGVRVHLHDVFLPDDYPPHWAIDLNRSWNEQYALQAMIAGNPRWRVLFGTQYAMTRCTDEARLAFGPLAGGDYIGGSFWIEAQ